ncbi:lytic transglycosylase domain-containing protein [Selenomonas flueggei]|uniref:lytic transglycosylase domain-containing protein n=1 Tax=Selenomonas flueggei TaxID=135080 RepID=UPI002672DEC4|nr:transglycosylase SLT domain-containing protein [Selenomonas flueggei]
MIGEMIQEYLVGLGVHLDKPGFGQAEATINSLDRTVETATGHMAANFVRASAMISTAIAGVTASAFGLMKSAASQDLAMQKLSRQMMVGKDAAWTMKAATDALGESIQDIMLTPELMERFNKLTADGQKMKVGGDFEATMKGFRDLMFEFTRLKQEVSYAMTWVGYYLMKYLNRPLAEAREKFRSFNDMFVKNMSVWTEKAARMLVYIINIGKHFLMLVLSVGKALWRMWESFPKGVKIATAALAGLALVMKANPLTRMMLLVSTLLLLIDDYYGHMEGKQSAFGEYWDKLNEYIETAKKKWEEFSGAVSDFFDRVQGSSALNDFIAEVKDLGSAIWELAETYAAAWVEEAKELYASMEKHGAVDGLSEAIGKLWGMFESLLGTVKDFFRWWKRLLGEVRRTKEYHDLIDAVGELAGALTETFNVILDLINIAFSGLFGEIGKTDHVYSFRDAIRAVFSIFTALLRVVTGAVKAFNELLTMMRDSSPFRRFWEELGRMIDRAIEKAGKFGRALIALKNGDFKGAWNLISGGSGGSSGKYEGSSKKAVDAAMLAISGQESGGNYDSVNSDSGALGAFQIMPDNWPSWAENAGLGADAPMTQENQNIVARHKMLEYYNQFGNWRDVAIAWYAGPGAVNYSEAAKNAPQYYNGNVYPSINEYADSVEARRNKIIADWGGLEEAPAQEEAPADASPAAGNMPYKLERPHYRATPVSTFAAPSYSIDPLLYTGLMTGARQTGYGGYPSQGSGGVVYQVNVGGVTVNGTNQNAAEIGRSVGRETMTQLEQKGAHILRSRTMTGAPVLV